jgi:hypothetical protein
MIDYLMRNINPLKMKEKISTMIIIMNFPVPMIKGETMII